MILYMSMFCVYFNVNVKYKGYNQYMLKRILNHLKYSLFLTNWYLCHLGGGSVPKYCSNTESFSICIVLTLYVLRRYLCHLGGGSVPMYYIYCGNEPLSDIIISIIFNLHRYLCRLGGGSVLLFCGVSYNTPTVIYEIKFNTNPTNIYLTEMHLFISTQAPTLVRTIQNGKLQKL